MASLTHPDVHTTVELGNKGLFGHHSVVDQCQFVHYLLSELKTENGSKLPKCSLLAVP